MMMRWNPTTDFGRMQDEMNRLLDGTTLPSRRRAQSERALAAWVPPVDVQENEQEIVVRAELPGLKKEQIAITVDDGVLTLSGDRAFAHEDRREQFVRVERAYGAFSRSFTLPTTVDSERIGAQLVDGVLTVTLPKRAEAQPRKIKVS